MDGGYFEDGFHALTGHPPFAWQQRLYEEHFAQGAVPAALDIPTGLGKTSVIVVWVFAVDETSEDSLF